MKKLLIYFLSVIILISSVSVCLFASANFNSEDLTNELRSYAYYMVSLDDATEMFSKNENEKIQPAAFAKLIAAIVAVEGWGNLDENVTVTQEALSLVTYDYTIRRAGICVGDVYTKRKLIDCLVVYSANDAASIIAYEIAGSKEAFVQKMQELVDKIGCKNTKIVDMLGFDSEGQYTTAKDVAEIIKYALSYPAFSEAFSARSVTMPATGENPERTYEGSNRMMVSSIADYYHSSVNAGKQTSTQQAGECIAVTTSKDGYSYLVIVMKGTLTDIDNDRVNENTCMTDAKALISWVYQNIRFKVVASPGQIVKCIDIAAAKGTNVLQLTAEKEISTLVPSGVSSHSVLIEAIEETIPKNLKAPVKAGQIICQAKVYYAEQELTTINLVAADDIGLSLFGLLMTGIAKVLKSSFFIALEIIAIIILAAYLAIKFYNFKEGKTVKVHSVNGKEKESSKKFEIGKIAEHFKSFKSSAGTKREKPSSEKKAARKPGQSKKDQ